MTILVGLALLAAPRRAYAQVATTTARVPPRIASAVDGCWQLGDSYRVVFRRTSSGLFADQRTLAGHTSAIRRERVRYDPAADVIGFPAIGSRHLSVVRLELRGSDLRYVFSTSRDHRTWHDNVPGVATRCR